MATSDSDFKAHQETWNGFIKGTIWVGAITVATLLLMLLFIA
jgi:hypothetical protein